LDGEGRQEQQHREKKKDQAVQEEDLRFRFFPGNGIRLEDKVRQQMRKEQFPENHAFLLVYTLSGVKMDVTPF
jgi:hypothetical protein